MPQDEQEEKYGTERKLSDAEEQMIVEHLQSLGYTLTKGAQFGADHLVYQGSPETHHAAACLRIIGSEAPPDPLLLAGFCRCANAARKDVILACWDKRLQVPHFMTIRQRPDAC
ncbi:g5379 [Coccomyxa viridis]|uniref:tRNA-intron lyase n=1 Tax=Coccomyxa viridis TaxID=1274662 RepID=A0ABP1FZD6_9CHLO